MSHRKGSWILSMISSYWRFFSCRRGSGSGEGCQDNHLQEDGRHLHAQAQNIKGVLQQGQSTGIFLLLFFPHLLSPGLRIRIHFIRIRIQLQHFRLNTDPDPDLIPIRIQSGSRALRTKKLKKKKPAEKKNLIYFGSNYNLPIPRPP